MLFASAESSASRAASVPAAASALVWLDSRRPPALAQRPRFPPGLFRVHLAATATVRSAAPPSPIYARTASAAAWRSAASAARSLPRAKRAVHLSIEVAHAGKESARAGRE